MSSFDSRAQVAQTCVVKSGTILAKKLDKALNLKDKLPDMAKSTGHGINGIQKDIDIFINDGVDAIETMSFSNYEINVRRRECIKPDLHEDYMSLLSSSVPINKFLFGDETSKRLEDIEKTNKVVQKAMVQKSLFFRGRHFKSGGSQSQTERQGYSQRPFS